MTAAPLYVIGLGPGSPSLLAPEASQALSESEVLVGYKGYIDLVPEEYKTGRTVIATGMMGEIVRAEAAVDAALEGKPTALVCSGDPGIYALSGLVLEIMEHRRVPVTDLPLRIVPGIPAVCAAAALLGAPLMHDFACVSLSDLLTPWPLILKRLESAFGGDFVLALYNPRSKRRQSQLEEALGMARRHKSPNTPVGVVKNAYRPTQEVILTTLGKVREEDVDMFTIVVIGNSASRIVPGRDGALDWNAGARMLTPRGYFEKYDPDAPGKKR